MPILRRMLFLKDARKIVPDLKYKDLKFAHHVGGIRPQLIDKDHRKLMMVRPRSIPVWVRFNMTPSPGATCCLRMPEVDMRKVADSSVRVDEEAGCCRPARQRHRHAIEDLPMHFISGDDAA